MSIRHFDELTKKALHSWEKRGTVVVLEEAQKITFNAMCKMLMSLEEPNELEMLRKDVAQVFQAMLAFPINLPWTTFHKGLKARKRIENTLAKIINERRRVIEYSNEHDLLQFLLSGEQSSDGPLLPSLTNKQIHDNILTLIIAGQETTANAITWMVKYLDENQDVQETLRDEQLKIKETSRASSLTVDDLNKMSYASKVVKESLRMASIVPWFPRVALEDCELEDFKIRKGWIINIDAKAMHLDPSVYQDPTRFHPPRFHELSKPYSFLAFGTGVRTCLGMNLAKYMMLAFLHRLITTYRWESMDSDLTLEKRALFSRLKSGCPVRVVRCQTSSTN
ncbi:hypothetical protein Syun_005106 [Stephania yunnanensis]|uniref:Cytochrome P450 n=1 Tax=Stephania yunnanensis TaxID=152371 RepID=A0AAP0L8B5_9MAGN